MLKIEYAIILQYKTKILGNFTTKSMPIHPQT